LTVIRPSPAPQADLVGPGDTRIAPARERTLMLALLCSFQGPKRKTPAGLAAGLSKLNSMQASPRGCHWPGSVDVLGAGTVSRPTVCGPGRTDRSSPGAP